MENVLSVGAGIEQIESINIAKRIGYRVIAIDGNESSMGAKYADLFFHVDIRDENKVIDIAKKYNIKAVLPSPLGRYLTTVGAINDAMGLNGITKLSANNCVDKFEFNNRLKENNLRCARQVLVCNDKEILEGIKLFGTPCVLKPRFGSGSNAVRVVEKVENIKEIINDHILEKENDQTIIEEMLLGTEYGIDGVIVNGVFQIILIREKIITDIPYRQELGYLCPAKLEDDVIRILENYLQKTCEALELDNCLIHGDIIIDINKNISAIEISGRPSGYFLSKEIVPLTTGIEYLKEGIMLSLGQKCNFKQKYMKNTVISFLPLKKGTVKEVPNIDDYKYKSKIYKYEINFKVGDKLDEIRKGKDIYERGRIITIGNTLEEAKKVLEELLVKFIIL